MRLIDADELMEHVYRDKLDSRELIADMVNNAPTIDAVQVVRCRDCKFEKDCTQRGFNDDFCSSGRRKDENN